jgi:tRNA pseudouridine32 synthase/23S rRNA pseudouridine746 synthase
MPLPDLTLLHVDDALLVLDKPAGLLAVPGRGADKQDCLSSRAQQQFPDALIVHRLDMATSGLMLLARGVAMQRALSQSFAERTVSKRYVAVVDGLLSAAPGEWGVIDMPLGADWQQRPRQCVDPLHGKASVTRWRVLDQNPQDQTTRLELEPITGRTHQLRVHLMALGHAIVGDALYASPRVQAMAARLLLHASSLALSHPLSGQPMQWHSPAPF